MNDIDTVTLRVKPDGSIVRVLPDGRERPHDMAGIDEERLDAMTDEQVEANARSDPDNPPWTDEELEQGLFARRLRRQREALGLSQAAFAERFHIPVASLRDWEQGRRMPDSATLAYLTVIEREPDMVARVLAAE